MTACGFMRKGNWEVACYEETRRLEVNLTPFIPVI